LPLPLFDAGRGAAGDCPTIFISWLKVLTPPASVVCPLLLSPHQRTTGYRIGFSSTSLDILFTTSRPTAVYDNINTNDARAYGTLISEARRYCGTSTLFDSAKHAAYTSCSKHFLAFWSTLWAYRTAAGDQACCRAVCLLPPPERGGSEPWPTMVLPQARLIWATRSRHLECGSNL